MKKDILNMLPKTKLSKLIMKDKKPTKTKKKSKDLDKWGIQMNLEHYNYKNNHNNKCFL
jgi:hypothetical protein